eukprot:1447243-Heterocapsa_arctica.AAC.1
MAATRALLSDRSWKCWQQSKGACPQDRQPPCKGRLANGWRLARTTIRPAATIPGASAAIG